MTNFFIGIDFSKGTFDATIMERDRLDEKGIHAVFENSAKGTKALVEWVMEQTQAGTREEVLFCGEDTGLYSKTVSDALALDGWFMWTQRVSKTRDGGTWLPTSAPRRSGCCS